MENCRVKGYDISMETFWSGFSGFVIGIGLAAACGFRIIIPFLGLSVAAANGWIDLVPQFQWIGTDAAFWAFATAAVLEIGAYYVPWMDNLLDTAATPLAVAAGVILTASVMTGISPFMKWTIALIAGGSIAGAIQTGTALLRGASTVSTGGTANFFIATAELFGSVVTTVLSLVIPVIAFTFALIVAILILIKITRKRRNSLNQNEI